MATFVQVIFDKLRPYQFKLMIIVAVIIFVYLGYFLYKRLIKPELKAQETGEDDIANRDKATSKECEIMIWKANWCPHCRNVAPEWNKFRAEYDNRRVGDYTILCKEIDCTDEDNEMSNKMIEKYSVEGFPTVKIIMDGKVIEYDAKITKENLETFVNNVVAAK